MESIITSQKSVASVTDPLIKSLINDITAILGGEMLQEIAVIETPSHFPQMAKRGAGTSNSPGGVTVSAAQKGQFKTFKTALAGKPNFSTDLLRLGIDLKKDIPASRQVNYSEKFAYLKGKASLLSTKLDQIGTSQVVPAVPYPDEDVTKLVTLLKSKDAAAGEYADYLYLLEKPKLAELYQKEIGGPNSISNLANLTLNKEDVKKVRRLAKHWELSPYDPASNYKKYKNRFLNLRITRVKCVDETEHEGVWPFIGEGIANDRIDLGAINIAHNGSVTRFGPQMVSDNFEDNREFPWRRQIARFDLAEMGEYPMNFGSTITIAEIDYCAGFANTLKDIFDNIKGVIVEVLTKIGEVIGSLIGSGEAGKIIGKIVGNLAVLGLGELINIIGRAVQDDVFPPQVVTLQIDSRYSTPLGLIDKLEGPFMFPEQKLIFNGHGGSYEVYCAWELVREQA